MSLQMPCKHTGLSADAKKHEMVPQIKPGTANLLGQRVTQNKTLIRYNSIRTKSM